MKRLLTLTLATLYILGVRADEIRFTNTIEVRPGDTRETIMAKAAHVVPTPNQLRALGEEFVAFIHFGPNSFTKKEWGNGFEDPSVFALDSLDTDQWCEAMRDAGIKMVILTAKHHDGFVLWQSRYTRHGVMSTGFRNGQGDIAKDLSASCKKYGLKLGIYLSPADLYQIESADGLYGNLSAATLRTIPTPVEGRPFGNKKRFQYVVDDYNEYFLNQLYELLTEYGPVHEVWFDGAHPKRKGGQSYNYEAWKELIQTLAPEAVIFGREDVRWCGNEAGATRETEWNVIPYSQNPDTASHFPDMMADELGSTDSLEKARYLHYQQTETNTSIREGWFYRDDTHQRTRSADDIFDIYERSVGGNSTFLLNIPPNREGKFSRQDVAVLREVGTRIRETYGKDLFAGSKRTQRTANEIIITAKHPTKINRVVLQENIAERGERVARHAVDAWSDGGWHEVATATNVGYKRILRFPEVTTNRLRVRVVESRLTPEITTVTAHYYRPRPPQLEIARNDEGKVAISPASDGFRWKSHGENATANLSAGLKIYFTTNGTTPSPTNGELYTAPFTMANGEVRALACVGLESGAVATTLLNYEKNSWTTENTNNALTIDFGTSLDITGFSYTPIDGKSDILTVSGSVEASADGKIWSTLEDFEFGNLTNDPTTRRIHFKTATQSRFLRFNTPTNSITTENLEIF